MKDRTREAKGNTASGNSLSPAISECVAQRVCPGCRAPLVVLAGNIAPPGAIPRSPVLDCRQCEVSFQLSEPQTALLLSETERATLLPIAAAIVHVLSSRPRMSLRKVRIAVRGVLGRCTDANTDAALRLLGPSVQRVPARRRAHELSIDIDKVPMDIRSLPVRRQFAASSPGGAALAPHSLAVARHPRRSTATVGAALTPRQNSFKPNFTVK